MCPMLHGIAESAYAGMNKAFCNVHAREVVEESVREHEHVNIEMKPIWRSKINAQHRKAAKAAKHDTFELEFNPEGRPYANVPTPSFDDPIEHIPGMEMGSVHSFPATETSIGRGSEGSGNFSFPQYTHETDLSSFGSRRILPPPSQSRTPRHTETPRRQVGSQRDTSSLSSMLTSEPSPNVQQPGSLPTPTHSSGDNFRVIGFDPHGMQPPSLVREERQQDPNISTGNLSDPAPGQGQDELQAGPDSSQARGSAVTFLHHEIREGSGGYPSWSPRPSRSRQEQETGRQQERSSRGKVEKSRHSGSKSDKSKRR